VDDSAGRQRIDGDGGTVAGGVGGGGAGDRFDRCERTGVAGDVRTLARTYCARGTVVYYDQYELLSHTSAVGFWLMQAIDWINDRFAGRAAPNNCSSIPAGNALDPIPLP